LFDPCHWPNPTHCCIFLSFRFCAWEGRGRCVRATEAANEVVLAGGCARFGRSECARHTSGIARVHQRCARTPRRVHPSVPQAATFLTCEARARAPSSASCLLPDTLLPAGKRCRDLPLLPRSSLNLDSVT
jgi:hypothetical protein